jgi:AraC-like DNA-binding protein
MVIKEVSGKSAKDWIVEYIVLEIKALLKNTNMNIQEIAVKTNFANQSSLGRFFRKHTGMSLSQYRMSNLG